MQHNPVGYRRGIKGPFPILQNDRPATAPEPDDL